MRQGCHETGASGSTPRHHRLTMRAFERGASLRRLLPLPACLSAQANGRWRRPGRRGSSCRSGNRCTPRSTRSMTCSAATADATSACVCGSLSSPSKRSASQPGTCAPAPRGEIRDLGEIVHRQDARHDRDIDAGAAGALDVALVKIVIEEELGDGARRAIVHLALQHLDVGGEIRAFGMLFRIGRDRDVEIANRFFSAGDQFGAVVVAAGMRAVELRRRRRPDRRAAPRTV